jgi:serine phosphatase RsbU (regulator of sigma subunit)
MWMRLFPVGLLAVTMTAAFFIPPMVHYADIAIILLPAMTALVNGPIATAAATVVTVALVSAGTGALGILHFPPSEWGHVAPVAIMSVLCTGLAWLRNRVISRLLDITLVAETAQSAILRRLPERIGDLSLAVGYNTAADTPSLVGGDFYDVLETDFGVRAVVGDVQGHDLNTIQLTEALLGTFRERVLDEADLLGLAARMERRVRIDNRSREEWEQTFATAVFIEILPGRRLLRFILFGHPALLLVRERAELLSIPPMPPLGLADFGLHTAEVREAELKPDDLIIAYTDGLVDARNAAGRTYPLIPLVDANIAAGVRDPELLRRNLRASFFGGGYVRADDLTILIIRIPPGSD